jgi:hypothetical protein
VTHVHARTDQSGCSAVLPGPFFVRFGSFEAQRRDLSNAPELDVNRFFYAARRRPRADCTPALHVCTHGRTKAGAARYSLVRFPSSSARSKRSDETFPTHPRLTSIDFSTQRGSAETAHVRSAHVRSTHTQARTHHAHARAHANESEQRALTSRAAARAPAAGGTKIFQRPISATSAEVRLACLVDRVTSGRSFGATARHERRKMTISGKRARTRGRDRSLLLVPDTG